MNPIKQRGWPQGLALVVPVVVAVCGLYFAAGAGDRGISGVKSAPRLSVDETEHEFPEAEPGATLEHDFLIRNAGSRRLVLNRDECGCGKLVAEPLIVMPGEQATIAASIKVQSYPKRQQQVVVYTTSDPQRPEIEFTLVAELDWTTDAEIHSPSDLAEPGDVGKNIAQTVQY